MILMSLIIDDSAKARISELRKLQDKPDLMLRVRIEGGGCSGFQYRLELTQERETDDQMYDHYVLTDQVSLPFLTGAVIRFEHTLIGSEFKIDNPNAVSGCGCGTSFAV